MAFSNKSSGSDCAVARPFYGDISSAPRVVSLSGSDIDLVPFSVSYSRAFTNQQLIDFVRKRIGGNAPLRDAFYEAVSRVQPVRSARGDFFYAESSLCDALRSIHIVAHLADEIRSMVSLHLQWIHLS